MNFLNTIGLLAAITLLFIIVGHLLGDALGVQIALAISLAINLYIYWNSGTIALQRYDADPVTGATAPKLFAIVEKLAANANLPTPDIYIFNSNQPNAFATGRGPRDAAIAVSTSLLRILNREEIEGVIAHELAHIKNRDTLNMTVAATVAGTVCLFFLFPPSGSSGSRVLKAMGRVLAIAISPIAAMIIQMTVPHTHEFSADTLGARISGNPLGLASAIKTITDHVAKAPMQVANLHPSSAHLFICNPLSAGRIAKMFSTHPPLNERVAALNTLAKSEEFNPTRRI